jgi:hypothetical protein
MRLQVTILSLLILLGAGTPLSAQQQKNYVYQDTSLLYQEAPATEASAETDTDADPGITSTDTSEDEGIIYYIDTVLHPNGILLSKDSVMQLRNSKPYQYVHNLDSVLKQMQKEAQAQASNLQQNDSSWLDDLLSAGLTKVFFWSLAIFFIIFIVSRLFITKGFFQGRTARATVAIVGEDEAALHGTQDYDKHISAAIAMGNYRLATRYLYLQSLQHLAQEGELVLMADKTNAQYLQELAGKVWHPHFAMLTRNYEYIWYGGFNIDAAGFAKLQQQFKQLNNQVKHS